MKYETRDFSNGYGTGMSFDISAAPTGSDVFLWALSNINSNTITLSGWSVEQNRSAGAGAMKCMLLHRKKQSGDLSFNATWGSSTYWLYTWVAYSGIQSYITEPIFLSKISSGTALPTNSIQFGATEWAIGFFAGYLSSGLASWTPDSAMTERMDITRSSSPNLSLEIADTNGPVGTSPKSFTATSSINFTYGLAGVVKATPESGFTGWGLPI